MRPTEPLRTIALTGVLSLAAAAPAVAQAPAPAAAPETVSAAHGQTTSHRTSLTVRFLRRNVTLGRRTLATGVLRPARAGRAVRLQVRSGAGWRTVARDTTSAGGAWRLRFRAARASSLRIRVVSPATAGATSTTRSLGRVNVFRRALASWYGPGLYGGHLACGGRLSPSTLGVANKTLPCGTLVTLRHRGRSVRVPVVDRGPYVGAREFDLTSATRTRLAFSGTGTLLSTR